VANKVFEKFFRKTGAYTSVCEDFEENFSQNIGSQWAFGDTQ